MKNLGVFLYLLVMFLISGYVLWGLTGTDKEWLQVKTTLLIIVVIGALVYVLRLKKWFNKNNNDDIIIIKDNIRLTTEFIAEFYELYKKYIRNTDIPPDVKLLKAMKSEGELKIISRESELSDAISTA